MFAYCDNNPVTRADEGGEFWHIVAGAAVGVISQFVSGVVKNVLEGKTGADIFKNTGTAGEYFAAAVSGALCSIPGAGEAVSIACDVLAPAVQQGIDCARGDVKWSWNKYMEDVATNLVCDAVSNVISLDSPEFIRDIKDEARALEKKGKKALTSYLEKTQTKVFWINQGIDVAISVSATVYSEALSKICSMFKSMFK